jgi:hypothetical protein
LLFKSLDPVLEYGEENLSWLKIGMRYTPKIHFKQLKKSYNGYLTIFHPVMFIKLD